MTNATQEHTLESFVDDLVKEKGLDGMEAAVLDQIKKDLLIRAEDRINAIIATKMPAESLGDFDKILDSGSHEKIRDFAVAQIPNLDEIVATELLAFRKTYLGEV